MTFLGRSLHEKVKEYSPRKNNNTRSVEDKKKQNSLRGRQEKTTILASWTTKKQASKGIPNGLGTELKEARYRLKY